MTAPRPQEQRRPPSPPDTLPPRRGGGPSSYTYAVSANGSAQPAGFARLAAARRGLVQSAWALTAAALLALSGAFALPAQAQTTGICDRTAKIQEVILAAIAGISVCADVTAAHLAAITSFGVNGFGTSKQGISSLQAGDFAGLTGLTILNLSLNGLAALPEGIFSDLTAVTNISLEGKQPTSVPPEGIRRERQAAAAHFGVKLPHRDPRGACSGLAGLSHVDLDTNGLTGRPDRTFTKLVPFPIHWRTRALAFLVAPKFQELKDQGAQAGCGESERPPAGAHARRQSGQSGRR